MAWQQDKRCTHADRPAKTSYAVSVLVADNLVTVFSEPLTHRLWPDPAVDCHTAQDQYGTAQYSTMG